MSPKETENQQLNERLTDLEVKFAYTQETVDTLNEQVAKQWSVIDKLVRQLDMMRDQVETMAADMGKPGSEPPPPHY